MSKKSLLMLVFVVILSTTHILFLVFISHHEKSLDFVLKKVLITQTQRKPE